MPGFDNSVVYADNVDFSGGSPVTGKVTTDGQLLIGSTATPHIKVGSLASSGSTISITTGSGTINLETGSAIAKSIVTDSGTATPASGVIDLYANTSSATLCGASVSFSASGHEIDLNLTDATDNITLGRAAGTAVHTGSNNTGVGVGNFGSLTSGTNNVGVGYIALAALNSGHANDGFGYGALNALTTGQYNTAIGDEALFLLITGSYNIALGEHSAINYTGAESSNITIGNAGVVGESNVMRLGTQGTGNAQVSQTYIAGAVNMLSGLIVPVTAPGAYPYTTLVADQAIIVDTTSARTINLIASPVTGTTYRIKDKTGSAASNNITIVPNAGTIDGAANFKINSNYGSVDIIYNGTEWSVF